MKIAYFHTLTKIKDFLSSIIFNYCNKFGIYTLQSSWILNPIGNKIRTVLKSIKKTIFLSKLCFSLLMRYVNFHMQKTNPGIEDSYNSFRIEALEFEGIVESGMKNPTTYIELPGRKIRWDELTRKIWEEDGAQDISIVIKGSDNFAKLHEQEHKLRIYSANNIQENIAIELIDVFSKIKRMTDPRINCTYEITDVNL